jgi:hypothetical protein
VSLLEKAIIYGGREVGLGDKAELLPVELQKQDELDSEPKEVWEYWKKANYASLREKIGIDGARILRIAYCGEYVLYLEGLTGEEVRVLASDLM